jgi:hypothetical protein
MAKAEAGKNTVLCCNTIIVTISDPQLVTCTITSSFENSVDSVSMYLYTTISHTLLATGRGDRTGATSRTLKKSEAAGHLLCSSMT